MKKIKIGIDPGSDSGLAMTNSEGELFIVRTMKFHNVLFFLREVIEKNRYTFIPLHIVVEDARQRKYYGGNSNAKLQGAGAIKRQCTIIEELLQELHKHTPSFTFEFIHPIKGGTKWNANTFKRTTGWEGTCSEDARDAALLIFKKKIG